ncbi:hypothetical protein, partial [Nonomuraea sp. NPDC003201]
MLRKLLFWSCAVVFPLPLVLTYDSLSTDPEQLKLYIFLGLTAYAWWLMSILLSVRPSWLDRFVGLPAIFGLIIGGRTGAKLFRIETADKLPLDHGTYFSLTRPGRRDGFEGRRWLCTGGRPWMGCS